METKPTTAGKIARVISRAAMAIGITVIAGIGITCVVCLVIGIKEIINLIIA